MEIQMDKMNHIPTLSYLPKRPPVDIEFSDITYTVPQGRKGSKFILRNVSGFFKSGNLTAILGPSGAGKSTLLNVLAGCRHEDMTGTILINGEPRNIMKFRKMSRYIMQEDMLQPHLSVEELMLIAAHLKLGNELTMEQKVVSVREILEMLLLIKSKDTKTTLLSGGERKRLSIALELINNPPVIFLDEPTTGLDDLSSSQCIILLKMLAQQGRTIICSVHTPSAKLFSMFDHVYIVSMGQCVYQGVGNLIVPFLSSLNLICPTHYNPADFIIEVSSGEYGDVLEKMVSAVENGSCYCWLPSPQSSEVEHRREFLCKTSVENVDDMDSNNIVTSNHNGYEEDNTRYNFNCSFLSQVKLITNRMLLQAFRDKSNLTTQVVLYVFITFLIGSLYYNMGHDGAKQLFNFGFCYTCIIVFLYIPLLPTLLNFPIEVKLLKREYFNRWYSLNAYFFALCLAKLPLQLFFGTIYICVVYWLSDQPLEWYRLLQFVIVCHLMGFTSESFGLAIASRLNLVNGMFIGPVLAVPMILFAVYGMGSGIESIPIYMRILMYSSYLRFGFEGLMYAIYENGRPMLPCPEEEVYCHFRSPKILLNETGTENSNIYVSVFALIANIFFFKALSYFILRWRLSPHRSFATLNYVGRIIKTHFNTTPLYK